MNEPSSYNHNLFFAMSSTSSSKVWLDGSSARLAIRVSLEICKFEKARSIGSGGKESEIGEGLIMILGLLRSWRSLGRRLLRLEFEEMGLGLCKLECMYGSKVGIRLKSRGKEYGSLPFGFSGMGKGRGFCEVGLVTSRWRELII